MIGKIFEDEQRLIWDSVFQRADIWTAAHTVVQVLAVLKVIVKDIFQYKLLVVSTGPSEVSKSGRADN